MKKDILIALFILNVGQVLSTKQEEDIQDGILPNLPKDPKLSFPLEDTSLPSEDVDPIPVERDTGHVLADLELITNSKREANHANNNLEDKQEETIQGKDQRLPQVAALQGYPRTFPIQGRGHSLPRSSSGYQNFNYPGIPSCGLCSAERNLCQIISGIFTRSPLPYGYSLVTPIPAGVCNISIVELKQSKNFFALRRPNSGYVLNGNWKIQAAGSYAIAGTIFDYSPADGTRGEKLESSGPLIEALDLMIIYQSPNPGIKYEYRVPLSDAAGQQATRRIQASANPAGIANSFGLKNSNPILNNHPKPRIHSAGLRPNLLPNSGLPTRPGLQFQGQGRRPILTPNQPSLPSNGLGRIPTYLGTPQTSGSSILPPKSNSNIDLTGKIPNKNWGSSYIPPENGSADESRTNQGLHRVPLSKVPSHSSNPGVPIQFSPAVLEDTLLQTDLKGLLPGGKLQGILNTEPKEVPFYPIPNPEIKYEIAKSTTGNEFSSPNILGHSFTPRTTSISGIPVISETKHHVRHRHGSSKIVPGPAVGNNGLAVTSVRKVHRKNTLKKRGEKKKKKNRRKKGKKRRNKFVWVFKGLTECSKSCGGGNQSSMLSCVRRRKKKVVSDRLCNDVPKPENKLLSCNPKPCPAKWVPGEWGACSVSCGYGIQSRKLSCKQEVSQNLTLIVTEGACLDPKEDVETTQVCNIEECPRKDPHWAMEDWSPCSVSCGNGTRTRSIRCLANGKPVNDTLCLELEVRPKNQESCHMGSCSVDIWYFSEWSTKCSESCGEGIQTRRVFCVTENPEQKDVCPMDTKPDETRSCLEYTNCGGTWFAGPWSECSVSCGSGREVRAVSCLLNTGDNWKVAPYGECLDTERPSDSRACILEPCHSEWYLSEWDECSASCGGGLKERYTKCYDPERRPSDLCSPSTKPTTREICNTHRCLNLRTNGVGSGNSTDEKKIASHYAPEDKQTSFGSETISKALDKQPTSPPPHLTTKTPGSNEGKHKTSLPDEGTSEPILEVEEDKDNTRPNELQVDTQPQESLLNVISDQSADPLENSQQERDEIEEKKHKNVKTKKKKRKEKKKKKEDTAESKDPNCIDRIKNCHLVFRARLCPLKYYNTLCCSTCSQKPGSH